MRKRCELILKDHFRTSIIQYRQDRRLTQEQMAQRLGMSLRCYCNLESGKSCCSAVTLMMFLGMCDDPDTFIQEVNRELEAQMAGMA